MSLGFNFLNMFGLGGIGGCGTSNTLGQLFSGTNSIFDGYLGNNYNYVSCCNRGRSSASHGIGQYIGMAFAGLAINLLGGLANKFVSNLFDGKAGLSQGTSLESLRKQKTDIDDKIAKNTKAYAENTKAIDTLKNNKNNPLGENKESYEAVVTAAQAEFDRIGGLLSQAQADLKNANGAAALEPLNLELKAAVAIAQSKVDLLNQQKTVAEQNLRAAEKKREDAEKAALAQIDAEIKRLTEENIKLQEQANKLNTELDKVEKAIAKLENREVNSLTGKMLDESYKNLFDSDNNLVVANGVTPDYTAAYKTAMQKLSNKNNTEEDKKKYAKQIVELYGKLNESDITQLMKSVKKQADEILEQK